jgi:hypothetical protein
MIMGDPSRIEDGIAHVRDHVFPAVSAMDGCVGMSLLVDRETGRCIAATSWESEEAMRATMDQVLPLRDGAARILGSTDSEVDTWEVSVLHREHATPEGACARVTWLSGDPTVADHAGDVFRMGVLPKVEELGGFCSGSLLIDRATGRAVSTITFDDRSHLEASREAAAQIRAGASGELGATVDDVVEMEVAFAHLHVPEMA